MVVIPRSDGKFMYMGASTHTGYRSPRYMHIYRTLFERWSSAEKRGWLSGTFTIDGILRRTILHRINTRAGAGIFALYGANHTSYFFLDLMLKDGQAFELDATALQDWMHQTAILIEALGHGAVPPSMAMPQ